MISLISSVTGARYSADEPRWCGDNGELLDLEFEPRLDLHSLKSRPSTLWRYREALPLSNDRSIVSLGEPFTPLVPFDFDRRRVLIKQEQLFPTGSYKDRGAAVLISKAKELGIRTVVQDSSGNAGVAVAAYAAGAGIACHIYVPESVSKAKLAQLHWHGAAVHSVPGSREATALAARAAAQDTYYASHCWNPFFLHGTKTFAYEVCEQLGWKAPDVVILPAGNGTLVLGAALGFRELSRLGLIGRLPRIVAVQAANCSPLVQAFASGSNGIPDIPVAPTLAEGIAIARPVRGSQILGAVRASGGVFLSVTEEEIVSALKLVSSRGYYIEPTSAATVAGILAFLRSSPAEEVIVSAFTGHGLKSTEKMLALLSR
jgi:threonine synthase